MRIVNSQSIVWRTVGVGGTEVASLMGCAVEEDNKAFVMWAKKIQSREWPIIMKKVRELEQGTDEWLGWRNLGLGGSEVGSVMGASPFESPKVIWNKRINPKRGEQTENPNMKRGKALEPEARNLYEQCMGWGSEPLCVIHDQYDFVRCSLDGIRNDDRVILEIKCPGAKNHNKFQFISKVPDPLIRQQMFAECFDYYRYQVLYQLLITGAEACHFVSYCPKDFTGHEKFALIELYPEPEEQERLLKRVIEFWGYVEKRELPPADWLKPHCCSPTLIREYE